ncbi:MAG TPA: LuxR C-terminal-related transcriptional regulator [Ramlibacter sp.]|nr:LuxR C-terminal-related transcriptional regulator [Ramlibacter sp.]
MELIAKDGKQEGKQPGGLPVDNAAGSQAGLAALMDELAHGVVLTTAEGRMLHANQAARHELVRACVIGLWQGGMVQACRAESDRDLQSALARASSGRRSLVQLSALEGPSLSVAVVPVKPHGAEGSRCALVFSRGTVCDPLMLGFYARRHGITAAEELVLSALCAGHSAPQIASQLNVAVSTVRSHVRSICAKTRTSSVRELVQRVAVLPPVAPAFPHEAVH